MDNRLFKGVVPVQFAVYGNYDGNRIIQVGKNARDGEFAVQHRTFRGAPQATIQLTPEQDVLVIRRGRTPDARFTDVLDVPDEDLKTEGFPYEKALSARWIRPKAKTPDEIGMDVLADRAASVLQSWVSAFHFKQEDGGSPGLRAPQIGALFSILSHWTVRDDVATVVMPTGTGKTDTMVATYVQQQLKRLLVVVPTDPLREQIALKFASLGWLKEFGLLEPSAEYPVVGLVRKAFSDKNSSETFLSACNVIVTTLPLIASAGDDLVSSLTENCSTLFVDEAHHSPAPTWQKLRDAFVGKRIVQFTATPFRNDGKHVEGQVIFRYPLAKAQEEGYFSRLQFLGIAEVVEEKAHEAIAEKAVAQLRTDLRNGADHLLMARAASIARAEELGKIYESKASDLGVVVLHSRIAPAQRVDAILALREGRARVVVCVDMLGEGVDLPSLKIAALHDTHRSLAITLQFIGRFARTKANLGDATVVANVLDQTFERSLRLLYSQDADWNRLLSSLSDDETTKHAKRDAFARAFEGGVPSEIPMQNLFPKMSMVVYRTGSKEWQPEKAAEAFKPEEIAAGPFVNQAARTIVLVTVRKEPVEWGDVKGIVDTVYDLHIAHWNRDSGLFFVNSSEKENFHQQLATSVMEGEPELIIGEVVFRAINGINRLQLMNLGLRHTVNRRIQFSMMMGNDIVPALTDAQQQNRVKSNLFGYGFEGGEPTSIGCSRKGRVWSGKASTGVPEWLDWANAVGAKLVDERITTDLLLRHVIFPERAKTRPKSVPIVVEWDAEFLRYGEEHIFIVTADGQEVPFYEVDLTLLDYTDNEPIRFSVSTDSVSAEYQAVFGVGGVSYEPSGDDLLVRSGRKTLPLKEWFKDYPPVVRFADGSFLMGVDICTPRNMPVTAFDVARIDAWNWTGVDCTKESQRRERRTDSIQYKLIEELKAGKLGQYDIIFDDDARGESADVVAVFIQDRVAHIDLFHCKYAHGGESATRLDDLYEVCGQTQKSIAWCRDATKLFKHLRLREKKRVEKHKDTRFEVGDIKTLSQYIAVAAQIDVKYRIFVVQPGLSKAKATEGQLHLLGGTATYLQETYGIDLGVIAGA